MRLEKCLLVAILVSVGLGFAPFQVTEPVAINYKCKYDTCQNKWRLKSGNPDPTWDCGTACDGYCYFCDGITNMNLCLVDSNGTGCLPSHSSPQRCGNETKARCANITGGCACDELSIPPGQEPKECWLYTCNP
jgi:hypothetical protein